MRTPNAVGVTGLLAVALAVFAVHCDYDDLDDIPPGFADGIDNVGMATAGPGLVDDGAGTVSADFEGTGSDLGVADTVARSDHLHDAAYVLVGGDTMTGPLTMSAGSGGIDVQGGGVAVQGGLTVGSGSLTVGADDLYVPVGGVGVGIGVAVPTQKLDVNGSIRVRGALITDGDVTVGGTLNIQTTVRRVSIHNSAFVPANQATTYQRTASALQGGVSGGSVVMYAPVHLPDGAYISSMTARYNDADATQNISISLGYETDAGGATLSSIVSSGSGGMSTNTAAITGGHTVDNAANSYYVSASWITPVGSLNIRLVRVSIAYVINEPLP